MNIYLCYSLELLYELVRKEKVNINELSFFFLLFLLFELEAHVWAMDIAYVLNILVKASLPLGSLQ